MHTFWIIIAAVISLIMACIAWMSIMIALEKFLKKLLKRDENWKLDVGCGILSVFFLFPFLWFVCLFVILITFKYAYLLLKFLFS